MALSQSGVAAPRAHERSTLRQFVELLRTFPRQARLALGVRGVAWATAAGLVGLACCAVALIDLTQSVHRSEVDQQRRKSAEIQEFEQSSRYLIRSIHLMAYGAVSVAEGEPELRRSWTRFLGALDAVCKASDSGSAAASRRLAELCASGSVMRDLLAPQIPAFHPPDRMIDSSVMAQVISRIGEFNETRTAVVRQTDSVVERMATDYDVALLVLTLSTAGFVGAGLVLILLVGRAAMDYHTQWRDAHDARELLRETIDTVPAGIVVYDNRERLIVYNSAAAEVTPILRRPGSIGLTYEDLVRINTGPTGQFDGRPQSEAFEWIERFRSKGTRRLRQTADGRWFEWSEKLTASGRTVGLRVDVTELKEHESELEQARAQYQSLVDSLSDVVYALDDRGIFSFVSSSVVELLGIPAERVIGKRFIDFVVPEQVKEVIAGGRAHYSSTNHEVRQTQLRMKRADGAVRHVEARFRKPAGGITREVVQVGVLRDITERVELNERLERQMAERRATEQALFDAERLTTVGEMAATLAHEITQPLQVINVACASAADELSQGGENGTAMDRDFLKARIIRISQQVERASRIVGDLRAFVRGTAAEKAAPFDPAVAVQSAIDLTAHGVREARSSLTSSLGEGLPEVLGHVSKLEQVIVNLINNARDAGAPAIVVTAAVLDLKGSRFARISVEDTGPGISLDVLPRLFLSFVTTKPRGSGTGLGLRICRRIVEEMGGTICATNRAEGGACFEIVLPAVPT
jgi:PAS domain S-box-containing protein